MSNYGRSSHYLGEMGQTYFAQQNKSGIKKGKLNSYKFAKYIRPEDIVLEFGCGGGWILAALNCKNRIGVELNPSAHDACRANGVSVFTEIGDVATENIDVIISHHCLEHVPYPIKALSELSAKLKDDGLLLLVLPIDDWRVQKDCSGSDFDHHLHTWTPRLLANTLVEAGYEIVTINILTHAWFPKWELFFEKIPLFLFNGLCMFWAIFRCRRQLMAVAKKPDNLARATTAS